MTTAQSAGLNAVAVQKYLSEVAKTHRMGHATAEASHYPVMNALLTSLGQVCRPRMSALNAPKAIDGNFPDVALYEDSSNVLVMPVEVKGADQDLSSLAVSTQARSYAVSFGGGRVLSTNLRGFALSELDASTGKLVERDRVELVDSAARFTEKHPQPAPGSAERLAAMIEAASVTRASLTSPKLVARLLAYHGERMSAAILAAGDPADLLEAVASSLRDGLEMNLDEEMLVPTVVQTLLYGLFAAWLDVNDPQDFEWVGASYTLTMPVYADMVHAILTPAFVRKCNLLPHLSDAARVLSWVDRDAFTTAFDGGAIEYFYEPFLAQFDPHLRDRLGVWYTPREIADYQVARVDHHLRADLGIAQGLADDSVLVLDPACGTGTYLTAVLRRIHATHLANGEPPAVAAQRTAQAAAERVIGFELLPAAFVVAHINLGRFLAHLKAPLPQGGRLRIYLCNALTGWGSDARQPPPMPLPDLEAEIRAALEVKAEEPVLVVIGNPPYQGYSAAESADERALLAPWTAPLWSDYSVRKHRLGDLYVRFWRIGIQRIADLTGRGVVSFITNRQWLGGRSAPVMREDVVNRFQQVNVDDLHGGVHEGLPGDESVFLTRTSGGIRVGTAIVTAVRADPANGPAAAVARRDLIGSAADKQARLAGWAASADLPTAMTEDMSPLPVSRQTWWRLAVTDAGDAPPLDEYVSLTPLSGIQPSREEAATDTDEAALRARMTAYFDPAITWNDLVLAHPPLAVSKTGYQPHAVRDAYFAAGTVYEPNRVVRFAYRPFDLRWIYWPGDGRLLHRARLELQPHWLGVPGQNAITAPVTARRPGASRPYVSPAVPAFQIADPDARVLSRLRKDPPAPQDPADVLVFDEEQPQVPAPEPVPATNIAPQWIQAARAAGCVGTDDEIGDLLFYALIAVSYSPAWLALQPVQRDDFPGVPLPSDPQALADAAAAGRRIADLSDTSQDVPGVTNGTIDPAWAAVGVPDASVGAPALAEGRIGFYGGRYEGTSVLWDAGAGQGWRDVPAAVWDFSVSGYQALPKYLSYRVGQPLTGAERQKVFHLCRRIAAILALQPACDAAHAAAVQGPLALPVV